MLVLQGGPLRVRVRECACACVRAMRVRTFGQAVGWFFGEVGGGRGVGGGGGWGVVGGLGYGLLAWVRNTDEYLVCHRDVCGHVRTTAEREQSDNCAVRMQHAGLPCAHLMSRAARTVAATYRPGVPQYMMRMPCARWRGGGGGGGRRGGGGGAAVMRRSCSGGHAAVDLRTSCRAAGDLRQASPRLAHKPLPDAGTMPPASNLCGSRQVKQQARAAPPAPPPPPPPPPHPHTRTPTYTPPTPHTHGAGSTTNTASVHAAPTTVPAPP